MAKIIAITKIHKTANFKDSKRARRIFLNADRILFFEQSYVGRSRIGSKIFIDFGKKGKSIKVLEKPMEIADKITGQ